MAGEQLAGDGQPEDAGADHGQVALTGGRAHPCLSDQPEGSSREFETMGGMPTSTSFESPTNSSCSAPRVDGRQPLEHAPVEHEEADVTIVVQPLAEGTEAALPRRPTDSPGCTAPTRVAHGWPPRPETR